MSTITPVALLTALSVAAVATVETLQFAPKNGAKVERTVTWTESTSSRVVDVTLDGEPTTEVPTPYAAIERTFSIESMDQAVRSRPGQSLEFIRSFGPITLETSAELEIETPGGTAEIGFEGEGGSELEDVAVRFVWNADEEEWETSFAEDFDGSEDLLEGLAPTSELLALLPEGDEVEVGDRWDIEVDALVDLLVPGGRPPIEFESDLQSIDGVLDPLELPGVFECLVGDGEGDIEARVKSIEDGQVTITLTVDVKIAADKAEHVAALIEAALPDGVTAELQTADYLTSIDGTGEIVWDLGSARMMAFHFEAKVEVEVLLSADVTSNGQDFVFELIETREGDIRVEIE